MNFDTTFNKTTGLFTTKQTTGRMTAGICPNCGRGFDTADIPNECECGEPLYAKRKALSPKRATRKLKAVVEDDNTTSRLILDLAREVNCIGTMATRTPHMNELVTRAEQWIKLNAPAMWRAEGGK